MLQIVTFNLRTDQANDGQFHWSFRKDSVIEFIQTHNLDVICFQEVTKPMFDYLEKHLDNYQGFYIPRDEIGESTPLFIHKSIEVLESTGFFLTDTPFVPSRIPGSNHNRIGIHIKIHYHGVDLDIINTHLDYTSDSVCYNQSKHLLDYVKKYLKNDKFILTGDFNQSYGSETIGYLKTFLKDVYDSKPVSGTFHGFRGITSGMPIDFIFYTGLKLISYQIKIDKDPYLSDHYPVFANFKVGE